MRGSILLVLGLLASAHAGPDQRTLRAVRAAITKLKARDAETRVQGALELEYYRAASKSAVPHLAKALCDPEDWRVRSAAKRALTAIGGAGVPGLVKALRSRDPEVRAAICGVLKKAELLRHLEPHGKKLTVVFKDPDLGGRRAGIDLFTAWGGPAIDHLLPVLAASKPLARHAAVEALAGAAIDSVGRLSVALEEERKPLVREGVCIALGRIGRKASPAAPALAAALRDRNEGVRAEAARAIGRTGASYDAARQLLFEGLATESERLREGCIDGLAAYGSDAADGLVERLGAKSPVVRASATEALARMGSPGVTRLQEVLHDGSPAQRRAAAVLLRRAAARPRSDTLPGLWECAKHEDVAVRREAVAALGRLGRTCVVKRKSGRPSTTVQALLAGAADKDARVRAAALTSLGRLGSEEVRDTLAQASKDADPHVRLAAQFARWGIGEDAAAALAGLRAGLEDPATRAAAAVLLGRMHLAAEPAVPELAVLLEDKDPATRRAAAQALGRIVRAGRSEVRSLRGTWKQKASPAARKAIENGLAWLAKTQEANGGFWDSDKYGGGQIYDPGVTGLALWAFLGAGHTDTDNAHAATVRNGLDYLLRVQDVEGVLGSRTTISFQTLHACAGIALAEAWLLTGHARYAHAVRAAVDYAEGARNPGGAWRYEPRGGENDTHVTAWMVTVLRLADLGGFAVDPATYRGAASWIERMTDPNFGQIGYNFPGGAPARPEGKQEDFPVHLTQAMTAAGVWCRHLLGGPLVVDKTCKLGVRLCEEILPQWRASRIDLYYFHFGTLAVYQDRGSAWSKWKPALERAFVSSQSTDGSWPADGVWGEDGGKVYATAMGVLSLLVPYRYPPGFATKAPLPRPQRVVVKGLERALKDDDPGVRAAAERALGRILPPGW